VSDNGRAPAPDVIGAAEVCRICKISPARVSQLAHDPNSTFPDSTCIPAGGFQKHIRVWDRAAVIAWQQARTKPKRRAIYTLLMVYGRTHKLGVSARAAGVHKTTAIRWLRELGVPLASDRAD
jgi:hypothetical protein